MINRLDNGIMLLPALAWVIFSRGFRRSLSPVLLGMMPLIAWELFAIVYYGFPFPNSAYAKLSTGIPTILYARQGFFYLVDSIGMDPLTIPILLSGILLPFLNRDRIGYPIAIGLSVHIFYVLRVGGDFMTGRFLSVPFLVAAALIVRRYVPSFGTVGASAFCGAVLAVGLFSSLSPMKSDVNYTYDFSKMFNGICDERGYYYQDTGLLRAEAGRDMRNCGLVEGGRGQRAQKKQVITANQAGIFSFYAGPDVHIVDLFGMGDPLIARLPIENINEWRIGHFERRFPNGYFQLEVVLL